MTSHLCHHPLWLQVKDQSPCSLTCESGLTANPPMRSLRISTGDISQALFAYIVPSALTLNSCPSSCIPQDNPGRWGQASSGISDRAQKGFSKLLKAIELAKGRGGFEPLWSDLRCISFLQGKKSLRLQASWSCSLQDPKQWILQLS